MSYMVGCRDFMRGKSICFNLLFSVWIAIRKAVMQALAAAEVGETMGMINAARFYYDHIDGQNDDARMIELLEKAKEKQPRANYLLGLCYQNGRGVEQNKEIACQYFQQAAAQGDELAQEMIKQLITP